LRTLYAVNITFMFMMHTECIMMIRVVKTNDTNRILPVIQRH